jgi:hypothetical protein
LIVVVISLIISGVAFALYRSNTGYYLREEAYIQQQQNLRAAFYIMSRDLRMAGNGLRVLGPNVNLLNAWTPSRLAVDNGNFKIDIVPGWFSYPDSTENGIRAIFGIDGGDNQPDAITVFRAEVEYPAPLGLVKEIGSEFIDLDAAVKTDTVAAGDIIALVNENNAVILEVNSVSSNRITIVNNGRFTGPSGPPSTFPNLGSTVYNLRNVNLVTYYIDQINNRLMAAHHDPQYTGYDDPASKSVVVANNIEDLQIQYFFGSDEVDPDALEHTPDISTARLKNDKVKALGLAMTSRSGYGEGSTTRLRPALYNRLEGTTPDNRRRSTLSEFIYLRNYSK